MAGMVFMPPPEGGIYRVSKRQYEPFSPPSWDKAMEDGTFGNRFDDPGGRKVPQDARFRVIYAASLQSGAFGETLARFRPSPSVLMGMAQIEDEDEPIEQALTGVVDPSELDPLHAAHGLVSVAWRFERQIGHAFLPTEVHFVDLGSADTLRYLREAFLPTLHSSPLRGYIQNDFDFSDMMGRYRPLTQEIARFIYKHPADNGRPTGGIRYLSRLNPAWECWAMFHDRVSQRLGHSLPSEIDPENPQLLEAARILGLSIEVLRDQGVCIQPWFGAAR